MLHRSTKSVFAMDSLLEIGEGNIEHPALRTSSIVARNLGRVSLRLSLLSVDGVVTHLA